MTRHWPSTGMHTAIIVIRLVFLFAVTSGSNCGSLSNPQNGQVEIRSTEDGDSFAEYTCDEGFNLVGSPIRLCLSNGMYNGSAPVCEGM